ncbi:MAG: hypothetical protein WAP35_08835 [Solirubrobacterales bacterium]
MTKPARGPIARTFVAAVLLALALVASGCTDDSYNNDPKPPAVLTVSVTINEDETVVNPTRFGAGPIRLIITNQTGTKQQVTLSTDQLERTVSVDVSQTATFKETVESGLLTIDADNAVGEAFEVMVGPERESAQQDLDQP